MTINKNIYINNSPVFLRKKATPKIFKHIKHYLFNGLKKYLNVFFIILLDTEDCISISTHDVKLLNKIYNNID